MRDLVFYLHLLFGITLIALTVIILKNLKKDPKKVRVLSYITASISWLLLLPSANLYIRFYPATKTLIKAGSWPWAHSILMETKEHWGILLPIIATVAAGLVHNGNAHESKKWWILLIIVSILIAIMGKLVKIGALK